MVSGHRWRRGDRQSADRHGESFRPLAGDLAGGRIAAAAPSIPGLGFKPAKPGEDTIDYAIEGANVGYKWFAAHKLTPRYPFGHGLSYTQFRMDGLRVEANGSQLTASFEVENIGQREGAAVPQLYVTLPDGHATRCG